MVEKATEKVKGTSDLSVTKKSQFIEKYSEEKANGNSEFELSLSRDKITETKHKNNPNLLQRAKFLSFIEPFQGLTFDQIQKIKKDNPTLINDVDFVIKINFDRFVKRFEVEVEPIGSLLSSKKSREDNIKTVQDKFTELKSKNEKALIAYFMGGYPNEKDTISAIRGAVKGGVDIIEIGFPFSDPLADGPVIQKASTISLQKGFKMNQFFRIVEKIRSETNIPLILMTYTNVLYKHRRAGAYRHGPFWAGT